MTIPQDADSSSLLLQLWYGDLLVAEVSNVIVHQGTWFGDYRQDVTQEQGKLATLLCDFIAFVDDWHKHLEQGEHPDPNQFECFKEVLYSGLWHVKSPDGSELTIDEAPSFVSGEVCWNHPESKPNREQAAWEFLDRLIRR